MKKMFKISLEVEFDRALFSCCKNLNLEKHFCFFPRIQILQIPKNLLIFDFCVLIVWQGVLYTRKLRYEHFTPAFDYTIIFVKQQHWNTLSKGGFVLNLNLIWIELKGMHLIHDFYVVVGNYVVQKMRRRVTNTISVCI